MTAMSRILLARLVFGLIGGGLMLGAGRAQELKPVVPLRQAHAHNDYLHERPLWDALANGFCSVEADIWLAPEGLLIGHERKELQPGRTLEQLYLDPLRERAAAGGGRIYSD